jgi:hypothetical protein
MHDVSVIPQSISHFLQEAGEKGWEVFATLPYPGASDGALAVIFKLPL